MKGLFHVNPSKPRYSCTWEISKVLSYLSSLKLTAFIALSTAPRDQTLVSMNLDLMNVLESKVVFHFQELLKTCKLGKNFTLTLAVSRPSSAVRPKMVLAGPQFSIIRPKTCWPYIKCAEIIP